MSNQSPIYPVRFVAICLLPAGALIPVSFFFELEYQFLLTQYSSRFHCRESTSF
uniref:Uncharacterized protein n=1 Tax=Arundo donax TaxID=35708 RepID=A0A0A9C1U7_ARUDO